MFSTVTTVVLCPTGGTEKGYDRSNVDPLSAVVRGYDVAVPEDTNAVSHRVRAMCSFGAHSAPVVSF